MAFYSFVSVLLLTSAAFLNANPAQQNRITVVQTLLTGDGVLTYDGYTSRCINVLRDNVPSKIDIVGQTSSDRYRVDLFTTSCIDPVPNGLQTLFKSKGIIVNDRRPIFAFKLRDTDHRHVNVTFFGPSTKTYSVSTHSTCYKICNDDEDLTDAFPHSVNFTVHGNPTNNGVLLFSNTNCHPYEYMWTVTSNTAREINNLVQKTLKLDVKVRSFRVHTVRPQNIYSE